jgi:divalent metal cation (Fe/Co/Zn/Cd) transporter
VAKNRLQRGLRATFLGIAVNVVLGAAKFVAGFFGHSHALIADATEFAGGLARIGRGGGAGG